MLDLENDITRSFVDSCHSMQKAQRTNSPQNLEAHLDFLDDIDAFQSVTVKRDTLFYEDEFEL